MGWGNRSLLRAACCLSAAAAVGAALVLGPAAASADGGPVVASLSVTSGMPGTVVGVNGSGFLGGCVDGALPQVELGVQTLPVLATATDASVHFQVPVIRDGLYDVQVIDCTGAASPPVAADEFSVTLPPRPTVTSVSPRTGSVGTTITLVGKNLRLYCTDGRIPSIVFDNPDQVGDEVTVQDGDASISSWTDTKIIMRTPVHAAGLVDVLPHDCVGRTTIPSGTDVFTYLAPKVSSVAPASGTAGTKVVVKGSNFTGGCVAGATPTLLIGGAELTGSALLSSAATQIAAFAPPRSAGVVTVQVRNCVGDISAVVTASKYTYLAPKITSMLPTSGKAGTLVTVNGAGFTNGCVSGTSAPVVQFGATTLVPGDSRYVSATATVVKVRVPVSPVGKVDVRVSDCLGDTTAVVNADKFTVTG